MENLVEKKIREAQKKYANQQAAYNEVPCATIACKFWDVKAEQRCGAEIHGEPAVISCNDYTPLEESNAPGEGRGIPRTLDPVVGNSGENDA